jgi:hypothetical protein
VVECTGLENRRTLIAFPGFESLVSRQTSFRPRIGGAFSFLPFLIIALQITTRAGVPIVAIHQEKNIEIGQEVVRLHYDHGRNGQFGPHHRACLRVETMASGKAGHRLRDGSLTEQANRRQFDVRRPRSADTLLRIS